MTFRPKFDELSFIPGVNVPETTTIDNYAERHGSLDKPNVYRLAIDHNMIDTHNIQINAPCQTNIAPMLGLSHWFYGSEFTIPENNIEAIGSGSYIAGYIKNNTQQQYYKFNYKNPNTLKKSGLPKDILQGDIGYYTCDGYSLGILNGGPVFISANPFASVECYDMNSTVKINAFYHVLNTAITKKYPTCSNKENWHDVSKISEIEQWFDNYKIIKGYNGPYITSCTEKFYSNIDLNGSYFLSSSTEHISNVGKIPSIEKLRETPQTSDFKWKQNPISQELNYIADMYKNQYGKYDITDKDFSSDSLIHQRKDGSICITNKTGSCIEMTAEGDIVISPKRDLIFQAGRNMVGVVGNTIDLISKNSCLLRSNTQNIQLTGNNINIISKEELNIQNKKTTVISDDYYHKTTNDVYNVTNSQRQTTSNIEKHTTNIISGTTQLCSFNEMRSSCNIKNERIVSSYNIHTQQYNLGSESFSIFGASSGNISGENPINIYHVHLRGFNYVRCGTAGNCKVVSIEADKPSVSVPNIQELNATSPETIITPTIEPEFSENTKIYQTSWQQMLTDTGSNWNTLEDDLKKNTYVDEENELSKSTYKIP